MTEIKIYDWPSQLWFQRADAGYAHASVAGTAYYTGQPLANGLALPKRMMVTATGLQANAGAVEVVRYALEPNNFVRMSDPNWQVGRPSAVARLAHNVVWVGAKWRSGAVWRGRIHLAQARVEGDDEIFLSGLPRAESVFRSGDMIGVGGVHYMVATPVVSGADGRASVRIVRGLRAAAAFGDGVEYPVRHIFKAVIAAATDRAPSHSFEWSASFTEVFKSEFSGVVYRDASFFK